MPARDWLTLLQQPNLRGRLALMGDVKALARLYFLSSAQRIGLLSELEGPPASADSLTARLGVEHSDLFGALLRLGVFLRELSFDGERYRVVGARSKAFLGDGGDGLAAMVEEMTTYYASVFEHLPATLRGGPRGDYLEATAELVARSSRILEPFLIEFVRRVAGTGKPTRLLEIGCGSGTYVRHAAECNPQLTGVAVDLREDVVRTAATNLASWGVGDRFRVVAADIRTPPADIGGPFDLVTLYNNIYYFEPEEWPELVRRVRGWLAPGGALALVSMMRGDTLGSLGADIVFRCTEGLAPLPHLNNLTATLRVGGFHDITSAKLVPGESVYGIIAR
jgi:SAM-dependent methyltransferase